MTWLMERMTYGEKYGCSVGEGRVGLQQCCLLFFKGDCFEGKLAGRLLLSGCFAHGSEAPYVCAEVRDMGIWTTVESWDSECHF